MRPITNGLTEFRVSFQKTRRRWISVCPHQESGSPPEGQTHYTEDNYGQCLRAVGAWCKRNSGEKPVTFREEGEL